MEAIKTRLKAIAWFLTALMLFQSCVVYHKTPTTLENATKEQTKTKIINTNDETFKYKNITYEDGVFYGVNKRSGEFVKTPLDEEYISNVFTKNKKASTWLTVGIIGLPILFLVFGSILVATEGVDIGDPGWGDQGPK